MVGALAPEAPRESAVGVDHEVAAELKRVLRGPPQTAGAIATDEPCIAASGPQTPYATDRPAAESEGPVALAVGVSERHEPEVVSRLVVTQRGGVGECNQRDECLISELTDAVAHGDRVVGARQSMDVAMKHQHDDGSPMIAEFPGSAG